MSAALAATACAGAEAASTAVDDTEVAALTCVAAPEGLRHWWTLDEASVYAAGGAVWLDQVGQLEAADTAGNAIAPGAAMVNGSVEMNGSSFLTDYIEFGLDDFTIALWIRPAGPRRGDSSKVLDQAIFFHQGKSAGIGLGIQDQQLSLQFTGPRSTQVHRGPMIESDKWQFVSVQVDRDGMSRLAIDERSVEHPTDFDRSVSFERSGLPSTVLGGGLGNNQALDEITIFDRYVTDDELETIRAAETAGQCR